MNTAYLTPLLALGGGGSSDFDYNGKFSNTPTPPPVVDILSEDIGIDVGAPNWSEDVSSHFSDSDGQIVSYRVTLNNGNAFPS